ncbi:choice-of-anchor Q domain-containing protein [Chondromyces apiculatus]|uniref:PE-PGRS family protein n=1 Tax=Chondromyces apiculatus DSM 436 TaxID=1192034 RepID=A0A017SYP5_9BACT|nr:choice-of-anchor Q domain-containing protein [Chondromyces apiculatus]EYF01431.1 Hypothetical protein CAP_8362 [Chondromyces apiculatus DSM 436]
MSGSSTARGARGGAGGAGGSGAEGGSGGAGAQGGAGGSGNAGGAGGAGGADAVCGNGIVEAGEACDGDCPATCADDGDACTASVLSGTPETCDVTCVDTPITACVTGDGCCPTGCTAPGDLDCVACDLTVPDDHPTIGAAILAATAPAVVCVRPGQYVESLTLRPHVSLQGYGPTTEIVGEISAIDLPDPDPTPTTLRDLRVVGDHGGIVSSCPLNDTLCSSTLSFPGETLSLTMERVSLVASDVATSTIYCGRFALYQGSYTITFRDSSCITADRGFRVQSSVASAPVTHELIVERSTFMPAASNGGWVYDAVEFLPGQSGSGTCGATTSPAGTRFKATIINNEFHQTYYDAIYATRCVSLTAADRAQSGIDIRNNTFVTREGATGDMAYSIWINGVGNYDPPVTVANNLYWRTNANPVRGLTPNVSAGNLLPAANPFLDLAAGDLHLAPGSAAIDTADPTHAPPVDKAGLPRPVDGDQNGTSLPDVGAHEYTP